MFVEVTMLFYSLCCNPYFFVCFLVAPHNLHGSQFPDQGLNPGHGNESAESWPLNHKELPCNPYFCLIWTESAAMLSVNYGEYVTSREILFHFWGKRIFDLPFILIRSHCAGLTGTWQVWLQETESNHWLRKLLACWSGVHIPLCFVFDLPSSSHIELVKMWL